MYRVRLVFPDIPEAPPKRKDAELADLVHAVSRARHELDLERFLAAHCVPPRPAPVAVQILNHGRVVWQMTESERAGERVS